MLKKALTTIILFQILTIIALGVLLYYLYKVRVKEQVNYTDVRVEVNDNTIDKVKAEGLTLDSIVRPQENPDFQESFFVTASTNNSGVSIQPVYKIKDGSVTKATNVSVAAIPMFYTDLNSPNLTDDQIIELITLAVKQDNLQEIDIDVSIVNKVTNIESVVRSILSNLNPSNLNINIGIPLKWSDNMDYSYLDSVSRFYKSTASIEILNNLCNKIRLHGYGYTSINSASAGPITMSELTEDSIKYYIAKGISRSKIDLVINSSAYMWANRSFTDNYLRNYVLDTQQVIILSEQQTNEYTSSTSFTSIRSLGNGENLGLYTNNGNINYLVYPTLTQISAMQELARSYGLNGFILHSKPF